MPHSQTIVLTGYRATGKSSVGKALGARLGFEFIDMDKVIEARAGQSISTLVAARGWEGFRAMEKGLLRELAADTSAAVVATGGGAILHEEIWPAVMAAATVVWLSADPATICARLLADNATAGQRPSLTGDDVCREVEEVLARREPLYQRWNHMCIDTAHRGVDEIVELIVEFYHHLG